MIGIPHRIRDSLELHHHIYHSGCQAQHPPCLHSSYYRCLALGFPLSVWIWPWLSGTQDDHFIYFMLATVQTVLHLGEGGAISFDTCHGSHWECG